MFASLHEWYLGSSLFILLSTPQKVARLLLSRNAHTAQNVHQENLLRDGPAFDIILIYPRRGVAFGRSSEIEVPARTLSRTRYVAGHHTEALAGPIALQRIDPTDGIAGFDSSGHYADFFVDVVLGAEIYACV